MSDIDTDPEMVAPVGLRERKKARTHEAILRAAAELFSEVGYSAAHTAAIADRAEVSEATLFRYFPTKADLAIEPSRRSAARLIEALEARPLAESPFEALVAVARSDLAGEFFDERAREHTDRLNANPELLALAFQLLLGSAGQLAENFARRIGTVPPDPKAKVLAHAALGAVLVSIDEWVVDDAIEPHQRFVGLLEALRPVLE